MKQFQRFLDRINRAQPLSPVTMYYLGFVTAVALDTDHWPDGLLFEAVLHATDMQKIITGQLTHSIIAETRRWGAVKQSE